MKILNGMYWFHYDYAVPASINANAWKMSYPVTGNWQTAKRRMMIVIDHVPFKDIPKTDPDHNDPNDGALLAHGWLKSFENMLQDAFSTAEKWHPEIDRTEWAFTFIPFFWFKTAGLNKSNMKVANKHATKRLRKIVGEMNPTHLHLMLNNKINDTDFGIRYSKYGKVFKKIVEGIKLRVSANISITSIDGLKNHRTQGRRSNIVGHANELIARLLSDGNYPYSLAHIKPNVRIVKNMKQWKILYKKLLSAKTIGFDLETRNLTVHENDILTAQFAFDENLSYLLPVKHMDTPWTADELKIVMTDLRHLFSRRFPNNWDAPVLVGHNIGFDIRILRQELGISFIYYKLWDTMAADWILDENLIELRYYGLREFGLNAVCARYENYFYDDSEGFTKDDRDNIEGFSLDTDLINYCGMDAQLPLGLMRVQKERAALLPCDESDSWLPYYEKLVMGVYGDTVTAISHMEQHGIQVDVEHAKKELDVERSSMIPERDRMIAELYSTDMAKKANAKLLDSRSISSEGSMFETDDMWVLDLMSKRDHKRLFFFDEDMLNLETTVTEAGNPQVNAEFMDFYSLEGSVNYVQEVDMYKKVMEFEGTWQFLEGYLRFANPIDNRVRARYGWRIISGRSNSFEPSLQNVPTHSKYAKVIKRCFVSNKDTVLVKNDQSTFEMRMWGNISFDTALQAVFEEIGQAKLNYIADPTEENKKILGIKDFHKMIYSSFSGVPLEKVSKEERQAAKGVNFGATYGKAPQTLADELGRPLDEMNKILKDYFTKFKQAGDWLENIQVLGQKRGFICNPFQFRRNLKGHMLGLKGGTNALNRVSMNAPIQGYASQVNFVVAANILRGIDEKYKHMHRFRWNERTQKFDLRTEGFKLVAMVHDSIENEVPLKILSSAVKLIEYHSTEGMTHHLRDLYGIDLLIPLATDFDIGDSGDKMNSLDGTQAGMKAAVLQAIADKKERLKITELA